MSIIHRITSVALAAAVITGTSLGATPQAQAAFNYAYQKKCAPGSQVVIVVTHPGGPTTVYGTTLQKIPRAGDHAFKQRFEGTGTDYWYTGRNYVSWSHNDSYYDRYTTSYGYCTNVWR